MFATGPKVGRESVRVVAVDGRSSCLGLRPLWVITLVAVDGRCLVALEEESPDVEGRILLACEEEVILSAPALVVALRFLCSLV